MSAFSLSVQFVPCHSNNIRHAKQCIHFDHAWRFSVFGILCGKLFWSAHWMATNWKWDITKLILECDWDISPQSETETDSDADDITDTTQWTDSTKCWPAVPLVHRFKGNASGLQDCSRNVCVFVNYCVHGEQWEGYFESLLVDTRTAVHNPYGNVMKCDIFFHVLRFLFFCDNQKDPDKTGDTCDQLQKMRTILDKLNMLNIAVQLSI